MYGWFGVDAQLDREKLRDELIRNKAIKIEVIEGENFDMSQIDNYLQPILNRINQEILETFKPPEKVEIASTSDLSVGEGWIGLGYSVAVKDFKNVKKGKETIDFTISLKNAARLRQDLLGLVAIPQNCINVW